MQSLSRKYQIQFLIRGILNRLYKPWVKYYTSYERMFNYKGLKIIVPSGVFHPGFYFSTKIFAGFIEQFELTDKNVWEAGCGSGLLSLVALKKGAVVLASDVNPDALKAIQSSHSLNPGLPKNNLKSVESDLFDNIPKQSFDFILINPPFFRGNAGNVQEQAWYCGENFEYFQKLFNGIKEYVHDTSQALMIISNHADLEMINKIANENSFQLIEMFRKRNLVETNFIFRISKLND